MMPQWVLTFTSSLVLSFFSPLLLESKEKSTIVSTHIRLIYWCVLVGIWGQTIVILQKVWNGHHGGRFGTRIFTVCTAVQCCKLFGVPVWCYKHCICLQTLLCCTVYCCCHTVYEYGHVIFTQQSDSTKQWIDNSTVSNVYCHSLPILFLPLHSSEIDSFLFWRLWIHQVHVRPGQHTPIAHLLWGLVTLNDLAHIWVLLTPVVNN